MESKVHRCIPLTYLPHYLLLDDKSCVGFICVSRIFRMAFWANGLYRMEKIEKTFGSFFWGMSLLFILIGTHMNETIPILMDIHIAIPQSVVWLIVGRCQ